MDDASGSRDGDGGGSGSGDFGLGGGGGLEDALGFGEEDGEDEGGF